MARHNQRRCHNRRPHPTIITNVITTTGKNTECNGHGGPHTKSIHGSNEPAAINR